MPRGWMSASSRKRRRGWELHGSRGTSGRSRLGGLGRFGANVHHDDALHSVRVVSGVQHRVPAAHREAGESESVESERGQVFDEAVAGISVGGRNRTRRVPAGLGHRRGTNRAWPRRTRPIYGLAGVSMPGRPGAASLRIPSRSNGYGCR